MVTQIDFPQESIAQAKQIVRKYHNRSRSRKTLAAFIYDRAFFEIGYGLSESIRDGNCGKYLHEIKKEGDCYTTAGVLYLIAREAKLNPQLWMTTGMKDYREGQDPSEIGLGDHTFITVGVGSEGEYVVDPNMGLFGRVSFHPERNLMKTSSPKRGEIRYRSFQSIRRMSEKEYLEMLEKSRSAEGGRITLSTTPMVWGAGHNRVYLTYFPETRELKSSIHDGVSRFYPDRKNTNSILDSITPVKEDGTFDFGKGRFEFYNVSSAGWGTHEGEQTHLIFPTNVAQQLWEIWDRIMVGLGRSRNSVNQMNFQRSAELILGEGFSDGFEVTPETLADRIIQAERRLKDSLIEIQEEQRQTARKFVKEAQTDPTSHRTLLFNTQQIKRSDAVRSPENPFGFLYSEEQYQGLAEEEFRKHKRATLISTGAGLHSQRVRAGLEKGTRYHSERNFNRTIEGAFKEARGFDQIMATAGRSHKGLFKLCAERALFHQEFGNPYALPLDKLKDGLSEQDLERAAQKELFNSLIRAYGFKKALFLASFKKGLQRILDQT